MFACAYCEHPLICDSCQKEYLPPSQQHYRSPSRERGGDHLPRLLSRCWNSPLIALQARPPTREARAVPRHPDVLLPRGSSHRAARNRPQQVFLAP